MHDRSDPGGRVRLPPPDVSRGAARPRREARNVGDLLFGSMLVTVCVIDSVVDPLCSLPGSFHGSFLVSK